tara:strand:+ start:1388 stop:1801 length:414 start_codon:yes stop_codon:yes gene_type:complete
LVYRNPLYATALSSFQVLETREFNQTAKLKSLTNSPRSVIRSLSACQVAEEGGGIIGQFIINSNGSNSAIPPISNLAFGTLTVDGTAFFETVTLDSGYIDVIIENQLPDSNSTNKIFPIQKKFINRYQLLIFNLYLT